MLRRRFAAAGGSRLPAGYQEVEWLQGGTTVVSGRTYGAYLDIGAALYNDFEVEMDVNSPSGEQGYLLDAYYISGSTYKEVASLLARTSYEIINVNSAFNASGLTGGAWHHVSFKRTTATIGTNAEVTIGATTTTGSLSSPATAATTCTLFARKPSSGAVPTGNISTAKLGEVKMKIAGTLVRDLIPCYLKNGNVPGMYDIVNDVFYQNAGSASFTPGPDI